ncbi:chromogranin-A [Myripristis murdjan]|uniref:chromogranin-A n=1 Tax=Myripristis murdjan TaxID=586833 RepID=UPI00117614A0|nr:chromogranin-A [Myripristis murdjan]
MIGRGLFILTALTSCVLSLPVTSSHLENEDVKVMKCIVEALTDVLSRPHSLPISQDCLVKMKTDDRLVTILRHHNFLKELQHIAVQGDQERAELQGDTVVSDHVTHIPQTTDPVPDQSMLDALGGPGERSILDQKRKTGNEDGGEEEEERMNYEESQERGERERGGTEEEKREKGSMTNWGEGKAEKREEGEDEERRANSEETAEEGYEEENMTKEKKGDESDEERDAPQAKSEETKFPKENKEESGEGLEKKRSPFFSHDDTQEEREQEEDEGEMKRGSRDSLKRWSKRAKSLPAKKRAGEKEVQPLGGEQEVPHHSKEAVAEEEDKSRGETRRSPEEKELQMIARRTPEERRVMEEEGSASRKPEEPEIESLAAIESELESVAQKLHELRRG